ncbi:MAG: DotU family type IV/VI secretion system protein [Planctomycetes bacterium]|nr:DotU family type IV/VI secretion system protein [Planctomycetota bacterium]
MKTIGHPVLVGLPDLCVDVLTFALQIRKMPDPGEYEAFRQQVEDLFASFDARAKEAGVSDEDAQMAKYALAAFLDEIVLNSNWFLKDAWAGTPLQMQYFNDFSAGEEFYHKLESLRNSDDPRKLDILEVYYLCLALGFKGRYSDLKGMERLKTLMDGVSKEIRKARVKGADGLAPAGLPPDPAAGVVKRFPVWIIAVACGAVLLILYTVFSSVLGMVHGGVVESFG